MTADGLPDLVVTAEDDLRRETIMRVMCDLSLDYAVMSKRFGIDFPAHFARLLRFRLHFVTQLLL